MSQTGDQPENKRGQRTLNLTLAAVAGQVGCLTLLIILVALFAGQWLDRYFGTRPLLTIILMVGSVPITLLLMFWVVRKATAQMRPVAKEKSQEKEEGIDSAKTA